MAKQKLESDALNLDSSFDFNFGDDDGFGSTMNQQSQKKGVISNVAKGIFTGAKDTAKNPSFIKSTLEKALPRTYGEVTKGVGEFTTEMYRLYDEQARELKPRLASIAGRMDQLVPEESKLLKKLTSKFAKMTGADSGVFGGSAENQEEQTVNTALSAIFQQQNIQNRVEGRRQILRDSIDKSRFEFNSRIFGSIDRNISTLVQYTTKVTQGYQRKMLELQLRGYIASRDHYSTSLKFFQMTQQQNEAIIRNTSLPEYEKISMMQRALDQGKNRLASNLFGDDSIIKRGAMRLAQSGREAMSGVHMALDNIDMMADSAVSMKEQIEEMNKALIDMGEPGLSKAEMMGAMAGGAALEFLRDKVTKRLKTRIEKHKKFTEFLGKAAQTMANPGAAIERLRGSDKWQDRMNDYDSVKGSGTRFLDFLLEHFTDQGVHRQFKGAHALDEMGDAYKGGFDKRAHLSLVEIIPGHLAAIHQEIKILRTGNTNTPLRTYDLQRGEFVDRKTMGDRITASLGKEIEGSGVRWSVDSATKNFADGTVMTDDVEIEVRRFLVRLSRIPNMDYSTQAIQETAAYDHLSPLAKSIVDQRLEKIDKSEDKEVLKYDMTKDIRRIRDTLPSLNKSIDSYTKSGYGDLLHERGFFKRNEEGDYAVDETAFAKFLEDHAIVRSDINVKEDIKETSPERVMQRVYGPNQAGINWQGKKGEMYQGGKKAAKWWDPKQAYEAFKKTRLYDWAYKKGKGDQRPHSGPMAQDVRRNFGEDAAPNGRMIDLQSMNGAAMAAVQHLGERVDDLTGTGKKGKAGAAGFLAAIKTNTDHIVQLMMGRGHAGGTPSLSGQGLLDMFRNAKRSLMDRLLGNERQENLKKHYQDARQAVEEHLHGAHATLGKNGRKAKDGLTKGFHEAKAAALKHLKKMGVLDDLSPEELEALSDKIDEKPGLIRTLLTEAANGAINIKDYLRDSFIDKKNGLNRLGRRGRITGKKLLRLGGKILNRHIPAGLSYINDVATSAYNAFRKAGEDYRDLYLPGSSEPVILASKLRAGEYFDAQTGNAITSMAELKGIKGRIVDAKGNVVVLAKDMKAGLVDPHGQLFKSAIAGTASVLGSTSAKLSDLLKGGLNHVMEKGVPGYPTLKRWFGSLAGKIGGMGGFGGLGGFGNKESHQVLVDIRDILLGDDEKVRERLKQEGEKAAEVDAVPASTAIPVIDNDGHEQAAAPLAAGPGGPAPKGQGLLSLFQRGKAAAEKHLGGPEGGSWWQRLKNKAAATKTAAGTSPWLDRLKNTRVGKLFGRGKDVAQAKQDEAVAKYDAAYEKDLADRRAGWNKPANKIDWRNLGKHPSATGSPVAGEQLSKLGRAKGKLGNLWGKAKGSKLGGFLGKGLGRAASFGGGLMSLAGNILGSPQDETQQAQEATSGTDPNKAKELAEGRAEGGPKHKTGFIPMGQRGKGDSDGDGIVDGSVEDQKRKQEELRESRQKKGAEADLSVRYGGGTGGGLFGSLNGIFDMIKGGLGSIFDMASGIFTKIPGLSSILGAGKAGMSAMSGLSKVVGKIGGPIVRGGGMLLKEGFKFGAKGLLRTAAFGLTRALPFVGGALLSAAGSAIATIGSVLLSGPVIALAATAAAGYGIYRLYKYANRNNANDFDKIRLAQYGLGNPETETYRNKVYTLEAYLTDGRVGYSNGKAYLIGKNIKAEDIAEIFGVDKEDSEMGERVATWYRDRFTPFFLTHLTALYAVDPKGKLDEIAKLKPAQQIKYLEAIGFESGPYGETTSPFKAIDNLSSGQEQTKNMIEGLIARIKEDLPKKDKEKDKFPEKKPVGPDSTKPNEENDEAARLKKPNAPKPDDKPTANPELQNALSGDDGPRPNIPSALETKSVATPGAIPMAPGAPLDGSGGLQYLKLGQGVNIKSLHPGVLKMLLGMAEEYGQSTGKTLQINDGFRSTEEQARLHASNPDKAAPPGRSLHEFGLAIDMNTADADTLEKLGLLKKYGFTRPVGGEPWHMEPAGIQRNLDLARRDPGQRDLMVDLSPFKGGGGYGTVQGATKYKRNQEMAMALLELPSKAAEKGGTKDAATALGTDGKALGTSGGLQNSFGDAANDTKSRQQEIAKKATQDNSENQNLPKVEPKQAQLDTAKDNASANTNTASDSDAEPKRTSSEGNTANGEVRDTIVKSAKRAGGDPNLMLAFAAVESDLNPNAKGSGTALGPFQFTRATWTESLAKYGSKYGIPMNTSPTDTAASTMMATEYLNKGLQNIKKVKPATGLTDAYLVHFLGPGGARTLLSAPPTAIAAELLPQAAASNRGIFYEPSGKARTVQELYENLAKRLKDKTARYDIPVDMGSLNTGGAGGRQVDGLGNESPTSLGSSNKTTLPFGAMGGQKAAPERKMVAASSSSGVFVDSGGSSSLAQERRQQAGESMSGVNLGKVETALDKSNSLLESQLDVLKQIADRLDPETLAKLLASVAAPKTAASNQETLKEKDRRNMGRTDQAVPSSVNLRRQA